MKLLPRYNAISMIMRSVENPHPVDWAPYQDYLDLSASWALTQQAAACLDALSDDLEQSGILVRGQFSEISSVSHDLPTGVFFGFRVTFRPDVDLEFGIVDVPDGDTIDQPWRIVCSATHRSSDGAVNITTSEGMDHVCVRGRAWPYRSGSIALTVFTPNLEEVSGHIRLSVQGGPHGQTRMIATHELSETEVNEIEPPELKEALAPFFLSPRVLQKLSNERVRSFTRQITTGDFAAFSRHCNSTRQSTLSRIGRMLQ